MSKTATLRFLGAAGTVTGSKYLVEVRGSRLLLDCGLFQGLKELRLRNWAPPLVDPTGIEAVVLTHAHIDHSGYLPRLVRAGFRGPIHCTSGTADLLRIMLLDSAHLQEEEARFANRHGYSKHHPALPLYTADDAEAALARLSPHLYGERFPVVAGASALFRRAGHILGAATVELRIGERAPLTLVDSGDLGRWSRPILRDPELVAEADVLLVESTYGDRLHPHDEREVLARIVNDAVARGGALIVPAFAVGRTQEIVWTLRTLEEAGAIPSLPVYVDSPMAIDVTEIYTRHVEDHDLDMQALTDAHRNPLSSRRFALARTPEQSKALNAYDGPMIIISASGMATGGRVLHHLRARLPDERTTVLLAGFQAIGTRGRSLQDGAKTLRMHGEDVPVRAHVEMLDGLSAHADRDEIMRWLAGFRRAPRVTYVVHGEPAPAASLAEIIRARLGWNVQVAEDGAVVPLVR